MLCLLLLPLLVKATLLELLQVQPDLLMTVTQGLRLELVSSTRGRAPDLI